MSSRWKPSVTPKPVSTYMIASTARSLQSTSSFHSRTTAATNATNGRTTPTRLEILCTRVMPCVLPQKLPSFMACGYEMTAALL